MYIIQIWTQNRVNQKLTIQKNGFKTKLSGHAEYSFPLADGESTAPPPDCEQKVFFFTPSLSKMKIGFDWEQRTSKGPDRGTSRGPDRGTFRGLDIGTSRGPERGTSRGPDSLSGLKDLVQA